MRRNDDRKPQCFGHFSTTDGLGANPLFSRGAWWSLTAFSDVCIHEILNRPRYYCPRACGVISSLAEWINQEGAGGRARTGTSCECSVCVQVKIPSPVLQPPLRRNEP